MKGAVLLLYIFYFLSEINFVDCRFNVDEINSIFYDVSILGVPVLKNDDEDLADNFVLSNKDGQEYVCSMPSDDETIFDSTKEREKRLEFVKNLTDNDIFDVLKSLDSRKCLTKTVGWWTYEFCNNRAVYQYHLDGNRLSEEKIILGRFESDQKLNHMNLIENFVDRKQTLYHSQLYANGSLCNLNSKLRQTEVRFFCDEDVSFAQLSRIDEPETCHYVFHIHLVGLCKLPAFLPTDKKRDSLNISCRPLLSAGDYELYQREEKRREEERLEKEKQKDLFKNLSKKNDMIKDESEFLSHLAKQVVERKNDVKKHEDDDPVIKKLWKDIERILDRDTADKQPANSDGKNKPNKLSVVDLNLNLGGGDPQVDDSEEDVDVDDLKSETHLNEEEDEALMDEFDRELKKYFLANPKKTLDLVRFNERIDAKVEEIMKEIQDETDPTEEQLEEDDQAARELSSTLNKLIDRMDRAEREIEMANDQLELAEQKLKQASQKLADVLESQQTSKNVETGSFDSDMQSSAEDVDGYEKRASWEHDSQPVTRKTPLGRMKIKRTSNEEVSEQTSANDRIKVRVSKIKSNGLPEKAVGKLSEETQKLEAQLASKLKKAGLDAKGGQIQVKIITSGYYDEETNNFHMLTDDESQQFSNIILSLLGSDEKSREENRQKSLENNYSFKLKKN